MGNQAMVKQDTLQDQDFQVYCKDSRLNLALLTNKFSKKQYILRKLPIRESKPSLEQIIMVRKVIHHPYVTPLIEYRYDTDKKNVNLLFQVPFRTFQEMRLEKSCTKKYLLEHELIAILHQISQGLSHLKKFTISHQSIKGSNFTIDSKNSVKVIDPLVKTLLSNYNRVKGNAANYPKEIYLSPQQHDSIKKNKCIKSGHEYSSDMFSLGMVILQMGLLRTLEDVYSLIQGIRVVILTNYLHEFESKYGSCIANILKRLLDLDSDKRMTLEELQIAIKIAMQNKRQHSNSTNSDVQSMFFNKAKLQTSKHLDIQEDVAKDQLQSKLSNTLVNTTSLHFLLSTLKKQSKSKSPQSTKRISPSRIKKKMLAQETTSLNAAIKKKLNNLIEVSDNIRGYQYNYNNEQKLNNKKVDCQKKVFHQRRNTTQCQFLKYLEEDIDQSQKQKINPSLKPLLISLNDVALNTSVYQDSPQRPGTKNRSIPNIYETLTQNKEKNINNMFNNNQSSVNFSFAPRFDEKILNESTIQYVQKDVVMAEYRLSQQNDKPFEATYQSSNRPSNELFPQLRNPPYEVSSLHPSVYQYNNHLLQPFQSNQHFLKSKLSKNRGMRHQSGDIVKTNTFCQMHVDLNKSSRLIQSKYQVIESCVTRTQNPFLSNNNSYRTSINPSKSKSKQHPSYINKNKLSLKSLEKIKQSTSQTQMQVKKNNNFEGQVLRGLKHGKGRFIFDDGAVYQGEWSFNRIHGTGKLFYKSKALAYDGQWFRDKMQGFGCLNNQHPIVSKKINYKNFNGFSNNWRTYKGTFKCDMRHGNGNLLFTSGEYYQGQFQNNYIHGEGVFIGDQISIQGRWEYGELVKIY